MSDIDDRKKAYANKFLPNAARVINHPQIAKMLSDGHKLEDLIKLVRLPKETTSELEKYNYLMSDLDDTADALTSLLPPDGGDHQHVVQWVKTHLKNENAIMVMDRGAYLLWETEKRRILSKREHQIQNSILSNPWQLPVNKIHLDYAMHEGGVVTVLIYMDGIKRHVWIDSSKLVAGQVIPIGPEHELKYTVSVDEWSSDSNDLSGELHDALDKYYHAR